jgi:hypothetical protein
MIGLSTTLAVGYGSGYSPAMRRHFAVDVRPTQAALRHVNASEWVGVDTGGPAGRVLLRLGLSRQGRLVCTGLIVGTAEPLWGDPPEIGEVTARQLRAIPLGEMIASLALSAAIGSKRPDDPIQAYLARVRGRPLRERVTPYPGPQARPGPKGHPSEHYERVAVAYREALVAHPRAPMKALAEQLHYSDATVRRWVQRARDKGLLGPSIPGKAGEEPQP